MSNGDAKNEISPQHLRVMKIITFALIFGPLAFLMIAFVIRSGKLLAADPWQVTIPLGIVGLVFAVTALPLSFVIPGVVATSSRKQMVKTSGAKASLGLAGIYQNSLITGLALLEGAAFLNIVVYLIDGTALPLITALVLLVVEATRFPSESKVTNWIENQRAMLNDDLNAG